MEKTCSKCGETKPLEHFHRQKAGRYGRKKQCKSCVKVYFKENADHIRVSRKLYMRKRRAEDHVYVMEDRFRSRLSDALRGLSKPATCRELVGCSWKELCDHIESQFTEGMTWDNRDKWDVDHIIPVKVFRDDGRGVDHPDCWHYSNLRPMWLGENRGRR